MTTLFYGTFIQLPPSPAVPATATTPPKHTLSVNHGVVWVSALNGRIEGFDWTVRNEQALTDFVEKMGWLVGNVDADADYGGQSKGKIRVEVVRAREERNGFFFPGFVDTHIHAPQYPNLGIFGSSTLLDWLETYTFPLESSFQGDADSNEAPLKAQIVYNRVVSRTLAHGTTCAAYYATIHVPATNLLATICHQRGQRALIGRVCMDNPSICPDYYRDKSASHSLAATKATISHIRSVDPKGALILPIVTPRFAPSCTSSALSQLSHLAASTSPPLHIQTHISENKDEVALVSSLFPDSRSYADVYDSVGLLTPRTVLAHAIHLSADERALIRSRSATVSHCPASNVAIGSGLCPVRTLLDDSIPVGLGTDVSGGYSPSILEAARQACLVSRLVAYSSSSDSGREKLSVEEALYLATRGGAQALRMEDQIGGFEIGMYWDAQMVELGRPHTSGDADGEEVTGPVDIFGWESWEEKIAKWMWRGDDRNVKAVWVGGRLVFPRTLLTGLFF